MADETKDAMESVATEEEVERTFDVPAVFCNKVYLTLQRPSMARLSFAEGRSADSEPRMRTAVSMTIADLVQLRDLLNGMIEGNVKKVELKKGESDG